MILEINPASNVIRAVWLFKKIMNIQKFKVKMKEIGVDVVSFYNLTIYKNKKWINSKLNFEVQDQSITQKRTMFTTFEQMSIYPDGDIR